MPEDKYREVRDTLAPGSFLWRRAHDENCDCGHLRSDHQDTLSWGHGDCLVEECDCMKFTWVPKKETP